MKTLRGRHKDGYVVIKLFVKPESGMSLLKQVKKFNGNNNKSCSFFLSPSKQCIYIYRGARSFTTSTQRFLFSKNIKYKTSNTIGSTIPLQ